MNFPIRTLIVEQPAFAAIDYPDDLPLDFIRELQAVDVECTRQARIELAQRPDIHTGEDDPRAVIAARTLNQWRAAGECGNEQMLFHRYIELCREASGIPHSGVCGG